MLKCGKDIKNNTLITYYWFLFKKFSFILQPFYEATIYSQGHKHMLCRWFTTINWLLRCLFDIKEDFKELQEKYSNNKEYTYLETSAFAL